MTTIALIQQYDYSESFIDNVVYLKKHLTKLFKDIPFKVLKFLLFIPMAIFVFFVSMFLWGLTTILFLYLTYITNKVIKEIQISNHQDFLFYFNINKKIKNITQKLNLELNIDKKYSFIYFALILFIKKAKGIQPKIETEIAKFNETPVNINFAEYHSASDLAEQRNPAYGNNYVI